MLVTIRYFYKLRRATERGVTWSCEKLSSVATADGKETVVVFEADGGEVDLGRKLHCPFAT